MNAKSNDTFDIDELQRVSGIPPRGRLGASRNVALALGLGLLILLAIALSFWFEAH